MSDNYYIIHPSTAGLGYSGKVRLTAARQWFDVENAPNLQTANVSIRINEASGLGIILMTDFNGNHSQKGGYFTYAHHLKLSPSYQDFHQLSFGLNVALLGTSIDETRLISNISDPIIFNRQTPNFLYINSDVGFSYNFFDYYLHFTAKNIFLSPKYIYSKAESGNSRYYVLTSGYTVSLKTFNMEPSILYKYDEFVFQNILDVNLKFYKSFKADVNFWGGFSHRWSFGKAFSNNRYISPFIGGTAKNIMLGYIFSQNFSDNASFGGNYHQISLGYTFLKSKAPYFCFCPSARN